MKTPMLKPFICAALTLSLAGSVIAAGQFGDSGRINAMAGMYDNGFGGKFGYTTPLNIQGLDRTGMGIMLDAEIGAGIGEEFSMGGMIGPDLVFTLNNTMDVYGGLGVGGQLVNSFEAGVGGKIGFNFIANGTPIFLEAGSHPSGLNFIGAGTRF